MRTALLRSLAVGAVALCLAACGGGGSSSSSRSSSSSSSSSSGGSNAIALSVDSFNQNAALNSLYVTVMICAAGSTTSCVTLDHMTLDTGSLGLRVLGSSLFSASSSVYAAISPVSYTASNAVSTDHTAGILAECAQFGGGYTWGSVRLVDLYFPNSNASIRKLPIQVIGDMGDAPSLCKSQAVTANTALTGATAADANGFWGDSTDLGSNGLIGINLFTEDCTACAQDALTQDPTNAQLYNQLSYTVCPTAGTSTGCTVNGTTVPLASQVANPLPLLAQDNNGYSIQMASIGTGGAPSVTGTLVLGIGTQSNNALPSGVTQFSIDPSYTPGFVTTVYTPVNSTVASTNTTALFDSGSSAYYFADSGIAPCTQQSFTGLYCPASTLSLTARIESSGGGNARTAAFSVANAQTALDDNTLSWAFNNVGGSAVDGDFIWGMPFFYGKTLYFSFAEDGSHNATGNGYYAY